MDGVKCSEEEFQLNRRTEFRILSINDEDRSAEDAAWAQQIAENQILRATLADTVKKPVETPARPVRPGKARKKTAQVKQQREDELERYAVKEEGMAVMFENSKAKNKLLAYHKTAATGTVVKVKNESNNREIFVWVIGKLSESEAMDTLIKLSKSAYERLEASTATFRVEVTYFK